MIRRPAVAGQFYPSSPPQLRAVMKSLVDESVAREEVIGVMSPHAGYIYSGPVAGATLSRVKLRDTVIIMGPNHTGTGKPLSIMTEGSWQTPLGQVKIDSALATALLSKSRDLQDDAIAHQFEHSIEVQLPFLQYFKSDIKFVPIVIGLATGDTCQRLGRDIAQVVRELGKKVVIIASSDMTHYESQESARKKDNQAIDAVLALDADELLSRVDRLGITMCGYAPVVSLIAAAKELGASKAELVKYQTSGDITGDYSSVVGYAGIIIKEA